MRSNSIIILEFPSNLGLKKKSAHPEPGVYKLPRWLAQQGFYQRVKPDQVLALPSQNYSMDIDPDSGVRNADKLIEYAVEQSQLLRDQLDREGFLLGIGGDCSILLGISLALKQHGRYGLFFLDGHTDFIGVDLSQTSAAAGMDLALVTGHGHGKLTNIGNHRPYFQETQVFCVGNRTYEPDYVEPMLQSDINYYDLRRLRKNGLRKTVDQFLDMVKAQQLDGFFVHLDVDVLDDRIMPAVDSRQPDGLTYSELSSVLRPLLTSPLAVGMDITILDPDLDPEGKFTKPFVENISAIMDSARSH